VRGGAQPRARFDAGHARDVAVLEYAWTQSPNFHTGATVPENR